MKHLSNRNFPGDFLQFVELRASSRFSKYNPKIRMLNDRGFKHLRYQWLFTSSSSEMLNFVSLFFPDWRTSMMNCSSMINKRHVADHVIGLNQLNLIGWLNTKTIHCGDPTAFIRWKKWMSEKEDEWGANYFVNPQVPVVFAISAKIYCPTFEEARYKWVKFKSLIIMNSM